MVNYPGTAKKKMNHLCLLKLIIACGAYNFKSIEIVAKAQNAIGYHARKSLLDYSNIPSDFQIKESLLDLSMPKDLVDELVAEIDADKAKKAKNLDTYKQLKESPR